MFVSQHGNTHAPDIHICFVPLVLSSSAKKHTDLAASLFDRFFTTALWVDLLTHSVVVVFIRQCVKSKLVSESVRSENVVRTRLLTFSESVLRLDQSQCRLWEWSHPFRIN